MNITRILREMQSPKDTYKFADVRIQNDRGSLRLQFSTRVSNKFYQKRQAYKGLGRADNKENRLWAEGIARRIQTDIDYPDGGLFDPSLVKYLDIKPMLSKVSNLPSAIAILTLGECWNEYVEWKRPQLKESTFKLTYIDRYGAMLKDFTERSFDSDCANDIISFLGDKQRNRPGSKNLLAALSAMCVRGIRRRTLTEDYFQEAKDYYKVGKKSRQLTDEEDFKAYSLTERNAILETFYSSPKASESHVAPLIEFLFLTGCRHGEAFALQWKDIKWEKEWIVFDDAYSSQVGKTQSTKTDTIRIFRMKGMNRLKTLLTRLHEAKDVVKPDDLIFTTVTGKHANTAVLKAAWYGGSYSAHGKTYHYKGVLKRMAEAGEVPYLKSYSTRHTFISIMANAGADLALLADSCGNSVEVIIKHYLQPDRDKQLPDI